MSDIAWHAVLAGRQTLTVWNMTAAGQAGPPESTSRDALAALPGPLVVAGLDVAPRPVPAVADILTTHAPGLPQAAAIRPLTQDNPAGATRGAEVAIAGYLADQPRFDGVLLVIAEDTCWAHISAEEVVSFQTFLTPDLMAALHSTPQATDAAFHDALSETLARPERLAQHLSSARTRATGQEAAHLIGAEIAAAKPYWLGQSVVVLGDPAAAQPYLAALEHQGVAAAPGDLDAARLAGFKAAWAQAAT